jgi:hypothetical protein
VYSIVERPFIVFKLLATSSRPVSCFAFVFRRRGGELGGQAFASLLEEWMWRGGWGLVWARSSGRVGTCVVELRGSYLGGLGCRGRLVQ